MVDITVPAFEIFYLLVMRTRFIDVAALAGALIGALLPSDLLVQKDFLLCSLVFLWARTSVLATNVYLQQIHKATIGLNPKRQASREII